MIGSKIGAALDANDRWRGCLDGMRARAAVGTVTPPANGLDALDVSYCATASQLHR